MIAKFDLVPKLLLGNLPFLQSSSFARASTKWIKKKGEMRYAFPPYGLLISQHLH